MINALYEYLLSADAFVLPVSVLVELHGTSVVVR